MAKSLYEKMWDAIEDESITRLKRLIKNDKFKKSFLETCNSDDETMLYRAAYLENKKMVKILVEAGAEINTPCGDSDMTPLMCALFENREDIAMYLYENGGDPYFKDVDGDCPFEYARENDFTDFANLVRVTEAEKSKNNAQKIIFKKDYDDFKAQEIYDFDDLVRIIVVTDKDEKSLSFQRDLFKDIQNEEGLQKAFNEHAKRGGESPEHTVFPDRMVKAKPATILKRGQS